MAVSEDLLLLLKSSTLGEGEPDLGEKLMKAFLSTMLEDQIFPALIICMNSGIFLTTTESPTAELLKQFERGGSKIQSCGTCLAYYGRRERLLVGTPGNMRDTVQALLRHRQVLQP